MSGNLKLAFVIEALDKATGPLKLVSRSIDAVAAPIKRIGALSDETARRFGRFMGNRLQAQAGVVRDRFNSLAGTSLGMAQSFGAVSLAAGGVFFALKRNIDVTDRAYDASQKLGISVEAYQKLGYAAEQSGSNQESMGDALQHLSRNMVAATTGSKEAAEWFNRVGIPLDKLKQMNSVQVLEAIADKFKSVGDTGQNAEKKIAVAQALMGRGGAEMKQMLDGGSESIRALGKEAEKMGAVVDGDTAQGMANFNDTFGKMQTSIFGVMSEITKHALPAMDSMVQKFTEMNVAGRAEWGKTIGETISKIVEALPAFLKTLATIGSAIVALVSLVNWLAEAMGGWQVVIYGLGALMGLKLVVGVFGLVSALAALIPTVWSLGFALMATPLGWFLGAIALLAGAVFLIYKNWTPITAFFAGLWGGVKAAFSAVYDWIMGKIMAIVGVVAKVGSAIAGAFGGGGGALGDMSFDAMGNPTGSAAASNEVTGNVPGRSTRRPSFDRLGNPTGQSVATALPSTSAQRSDVGGTIRLQIDQEGRARVADVKQNNKAVDFEVYSGTVMAS